MIDQRRLHRRAAQGAIALVCATLALVVLARLTGGGTDYRPDAPAVAAVDLVFTDEPGGAVAVFNAATGARLIEYGENEGVFVRAVMRSVARQRRMRDQGPEIPVRLKRLENDQLWLVDPASGVDFYLGAFGPDNTALFEEILTLDEAMVTAQAQGDRP
ncbi:MAG: photosynthetic complex assembly protein PuhC [Oceanicaulis sp.]